MLGPLSDAEQRIHSELLHLFDVEYVDADTELSQPNGTSGEFLRIEHVGRFVDEVARNHHTVCYAGAGSKRLLRSRHSRHRNLDSYLCCFLLLLLAFRLVTVKGIGAELYAECHFGNALGPKRVGGQIGDDRGLARPGRNLAHGSAAQLDEILDLEIACLADAEDDKT